MEFLRTHSLCFYKLALALMTICIVANFSFAEKAEDHRVLLGSSLDPTTLTIKSNVERQSHAVEDGGLVVTIEPGKKATPTLYITPQEGVWDLSEYGHIVAMITNLDTENPLRISMRVDNKGHWQTKPWNTEIIRVLPGKTQPLKVIFGYHYGYRPGFKLDPSAVEKVALFIEHPEEKYQYRIESIVAGGAKGETPQIKPKNVQIKPKHGVMLDESMSIDDTFLLSAANGTAKAIDDHVHVTFKASGDKRAAAIRPKVGRWNLNEYLEVAVTVTNTSDSEMTPSTWLDSSKGPSDVIVADGPLSPGQSATIVVPFRGGKVWQGPQSFESKPYRGTDGTVLASNAVTGVFVAPHADDGAVSLRIDSVVAAMPKAKPLPDWLGKRPPVEGDWEMTFDEEFDSSLDSSVWNIYTSNFWDKRSHFSKNNVIIEDGVVKLRFEKKTGHHNDDPEGKVTNYATGYLGTYGNWVQLYGYFEARMKLPDAPGLWPAFWLMPDRGEEAGPQWKRADTGNGAMEFDIMEHLTRWGPNRFTVAYHWDGYGKNHKATGTPIYFQPDADGYVTVGLLWLPGQSVVYTNGEEVARWDTDRTSSVQSYIIFTAVSGGWDNDPIDDQALPSDFVVDYVRAWQRVDLKQESK